jgi:pyruvate-formate lyase-activating enzyme
MAEALSPVERNRRLCRASFAAGAPISAGLPHSVRVEITNDCNLYCTYSAAAKEHGGCSQWLAKKPIGHMDMALYRRVVDELAPTMTQFFPYNFGEPFMNPRAAEMIRYARERAPKALFEVHTNGHYFRDERSRRDVLECGLDKLLFSIDGLRQESYVKYRVKGELAAALDALRGVAELKARAGAGPTLIFQYIVFPHNIDEAGEVESFARALGADEVHVKVNLPIVLEALRARDPGLASRLAPDSESVFGGGETCDFPWTHTTILADGRVVACCRDAMIEEPLGSVAAASVESVWNGPSYAAYRRRYAAGRDLPGACRACPAAKVRAAA